MKTEESQSAATVIVDRYRQAAEMEDAGANQYKGLRIHALAGLHAFIGEMASKYLIGAGHVLDLAAGSGAMSLRLRDLGFRVQATDYVETGFKLHGQIPFRQADLNTNFAMVFERGLDAVIASEIIEHLENPRHFAREAFQLLRPGGRMLLSTPNVDSMASKTLFLTTGRFLWFGDQQYRSDGHITPMTQWQLEAALREAGFRTLAKNSFGTAIARLSGSPRLQLAARMLERLFVRQAELNGEIFVIVVERPAN